MKIQRLASGSALVTEETMLSIFSTPRFNQDYKKKGERNMGRNIAGAKSSSHCCRYERRDHGLEFPRTFPSRMILPKYGSPRSSQAAVYLGGAPTSARFRRFAKRAVHDPISLSLSPSLSLARSFATRAFPIESDFWRHESCRIVRNIAERKDRFAILMFAD